MRKHIVCESRSKYMVVVVVVVGVCLESAGAKPPPGLLVTINAIGCPEVCCNKTPPEITVQVATKYCRPNSKPWE